MIDKGLHIAYFGN